MKLLWLMGNLYGKILGWPFLSKIHHAVINLSLHALGYGNMHLDGSGEKWFVKKILSSTNPKVILDVGANVGNYTKLLLLETNASVYAIEPNPDSFHKLSELNDRVFKIQCAISDKEGTANLYFKSSTDEQASLSPISSATKNSVSVDVKTLSQIATENALKEIDFIKIDTEGLEKEVISGLGEYKPKYIQFEFNINHLHRGVSLLDITKLLPGYSFYRLLPNGWLEVNPDKYLNNIFMFSNYVAVRKNPDKT